MRTRLLLLTDRSQLRLGRGLVRTVRECVDAGLAAVVVREHDLPPPQRSALIRELTGLGGLTVISSRIPDVAAHGVHAASCCNAELQPPPRIDGTADADVTPRYMLGRSCHTLAEVEAAAGEGVDYVTLSPYAESASKPGYGPALGPGAFAGEWPVPVYALGGIDRTNAAEAVGAGAHGVAVMGAVMRADDPAAVVRLLLREVDR
jgi:thiamine monophosphate synthase